MTFINWSDSHEMLGLLTEFVCDERQDSSDDPVRAIFLADVLEELQELTAHVDEMTDDESIGKLRMIQSSVTEEFRERLQAMRSSRSVVDGAAEPAPPPRKK